MVADITNTQILQIFKNLCHLFEDEKDRIMQCFPRIDSFFQKIKKGNFLLISV